MKTIEKLDRLPDAAMLQLSQNIENSNSSENPNNTENATENATSPGIGIVGENEVLQGGKHTALGSDSGLVSEPNLSGTSDPDKAATSPVLTQTPGAKQPVPIGTLFNGKAGIELVDMVFPALIILIADNVLGYAVDKKDLQLTAAEKNTIAPFMQAYLDSVNVQMSPLGALVAVMSGVYAAKFMEALPNIKKKAKTKQSTPFVQPTTKAEVVVKNLESVTNKVNKNLSLAEQRKQYAEFLKNMEYKVAIQHLKTSKRMSEKDSIVWYRKNVEPLKHSK